MFISTETLVCILPIWYCIIVDKLTDDEHVASLKCLASFLLIKPKKKKVDDRSSSYTAIPHLLIDAPV